MRRTILESALKNWQKEKHPHPILLRGARQVGKTYIAQQFGSENFRNVVYINFEKEPEYKKYFDEKESLEPKFILDRLLLIKGKEVQVGHTLLILDEIQECPRAILALRYFYEDMPGLHIIGAGSLLDFVLKAGKISIPVGRIQYLFMEPMSFNEFLAATNKNRLVEYIENLTLKTKFDELIHEKLLEEVKKYMILGGMPKVLEAYVGSGEQFIQPLQIQNTVALTYKEDFAKYSNITKHKYLEAVFNAVPHMVGTKFKYSHIDKELDGQGLKSALELLFKANVVRKIKRTTGDSLPLEVGASEKHFKIAFIDVGIMQKMLGLNLEIILSGDFHSSAAGSIAEQFVAQELLCQVDPYEERKLYYWSKEKRNDSAEVDFLSRVFQTPIPIEVKAGTTGSLKSLRSFMNKYNSSLGVRVSKHPLSFVDGLLSVPFYAVSQLHRIAKSLTYPHPAISHPEKKI